MIVIVDDHLDSAEYLARLLSRVGYRVAIYPSAADALAQIGRLSPRLIVLDVMMPEINGIECLRRIRQSDAWRDVPVVMYSADFSYERMKEAADEGAQEYLVKGTILWPHFLITIQKYAGQAEAPPTASL